MQLYADGFDALPLREKTLIWHLYQAALAGRDIFIDQKHRSALEMRGILDQIVAHPQGIDPATFAEIQRYTKLFWINNGPYNNLTARKFVLKTTPEAFAAAAKAAQAAGATFATQNGETLDATLARLQPMFFDPNVDPSVTTKAPPPGKDILTASCEQPVRRRRDDERPEGLHGKVRAQRAPREARTASSSRRSTRSTAATRSRSPRSSSTSRTRFRSPTEPMQNALRALIQWYRTGEQSDREKYDIAWVADKASPVDTINGFIEVYLDPRGIKGSWEALVFSVNPEKTEIIKTIGDNAQWFEDHMPCDAKYRKPNVNGHRRQRHRRDRRDGRFRSGHADRHQPAERSAHPRAVRQQVGLAVERRRGLRQVDARHDARRVLMDARGGRARHEVRIRSPTTCTPTCTR